MNKKTVSIIIGTSCAILAIAICVQLNTIKQAMATVSTDYTENNLRDEVLKAKEKYENVTNQLKDAEEQLDKVRQNATQNNESATKMEEEIKLNNALIGLADLEGQGIEITVQDDPNATRDNVGIFGSIETHIVHEGDLKWIVNLLRNAGAEAISINGQRIVSTTAITCVGNVIKINDEKVGNPFTIKAIGWPERLEPALNIAGGYVERLREEGVVVNIKKSNNIKIAKYTGVIPSKYMLTQK